MFGSLILCFLSRLVHIKLPNEAQTPSTSFQWWQPQHSGADVDQWALDEVVIDKYEDETMLEDDFDQHGLVLNLLL